MEDGDDDVGGGETQGSLSAGPERRPFVVQTEAEATARNLNNIGPDGLLSEARPMRRQAMTAAGGQRLKVQLTSKSDIGRVAGGTFVCVVLIRFRRCALLNGST